jgi:hypothetical protein
MFSSDFTASVTAGMMTKSIGIAGVMTLVPATVEPFLPAPPEHILSMVETRLKAAQPMAIKVGTTRMATKPNNWKKKIK